MKLVSTTFGERIKKLRDDKKLTQTAVGDAAGVTKGAVSSWEKGNTKNMQPEHLFAVADLFEVSARWLALGDSFDGAQNGTGNEKAVIDLARRISRLPAQKRELLMAIFTGNSSFGPDPEQATTLATAPRVKNTAKRA